MPRAAAILPKGSNKGAACDLENNDSIAVAVHNKQMTVRLI